MLCMKFLDSTNFLSDKIPDHAWQIINDLTERVQGDGHTVIPYIEYLHTKLNLINELQKNNIDNERLQLNRLLILLMLTQLELTRMC